MDYKKLPLNDKEKGCLINPQVLTSFLERVFIACSLYLFPDVFNVLQQPILLKMSQGNFSKRFLGMVRGTSNHYICQLSTFDIS